MLGDLRVLDAGDELLLDCERVVAAGALHHDPPLQARPRRRAAQAHARAGLLSLLGPEARAVAGAPGSPATEHAHRARARSAGAPVGLIATDLGVDVLLRRADTERVAARCARPAPPGRRGGGRDPPRGVRPPALRHRPRRRRDPPGGGAQPARRLVHQGLLRRAGDRRAAVLPRQAEPPPARPPAQRAGGPGGRRCGSASARSAPLGSVAASPVHGPIALALVRREAAPGSTLAVGDGGATATRRGTPRSHWRSLPARPVRLRRSTVGATHRWAAMPRTCSSSPT